MNQNHVIIASDCKIDQTMCVLKLTLIFFYIGLSIILPWHRSTIVSDYSNATIILFLSV